nr:unnamed protein product [Callosobruchus chinensis]
MKSLRKIKGVTRADRLRNEDIRNELGVEPVWSLIERNQLKWFGHMFVQDGQQQTSQKGLGMQNNAEQAERTTDYVMEQGSAGCY